MPSNQISKEEFDLYPVYSTNISSIATEREWYKNDSINTISVILEDKIDKDWTYMILGLEQDGQYRPLDFSVSISTLSDARIGLFRMDTILEKNGTSNKVLYETGRKIDKNEGLVITDVNAEIKKYLKKNPDKIYNLTPRKFEELIASILEDFGFSVELTKQTRDGGKDIIASIRNGVTNYLTYVEFKKYAKENKVGVDIIREVMGVHQLRKPSKSLIVTTSFFTKDAYEERRIVEQQLDLKDFNDIKRWLDEIQ